VVDEAHVLPLPERRTTRSLSEHGLHHGDHVARSGLVVHVDARGGQREWRCTTEGGKVGDRDGGYVIAGSGTGGASRAAGSVAFQSPPGPRRRRRPLVRSSCPASSTASLLHFTAAVDRASESGHSLVTPHVSRLAHRCLPPSLHVIGAIASPIHSCLRNRPNQPECPPPNTPKTTQIRSAVVKFQFCNQTIGIW
jgi:hypothetical protein